MTALVWGSVVLVLGLVSIWRFETIWKLRNTTAEQVQLLREQKAAELSRRTMDEQIELRKAELTKQTAETKQATALVEVTGGNQLIAQRRTIEARARAAEKLAEEFVRAKQATELSGPNLLDDFERYLSIMKGRGQSPLTLAQFAQTWRRS